MQQRCRQRVSPCCYSDVNLMSCMFFANGGPVLAEGRGSDQPLKYNRGHQIWFACGCWKRRLPTNHVWTNVRKLPIRLWEWKLEVPKRRLPAFLRSKSTRSCSVSWGACLRLRLWHLSGSERPKIISFPKMFSRRNAKVSQSAIEPFWRATCYISP